MPIDTEPRHPIGVVSDRTGLTPDVLRVWERRYSVVTPRRSAGGQRLYSDADIIRLRLLNRATRGGHGISHVASLTNAELENMVRQATAADVAPVLPQQSDEPHAAVAEAMTLTGQLDPSGVERLLRKNVARYGIVGFIDRIAAPFLRAIGEAWHHGKISIAQEHMATGIVQRVVSETAPLLSGSMDSPAIVIATLEGERHAIGALMAAATAASEGWRVIYLGADLPVRDIVEIATRTGARAVGVSVVVAERKARTAAELRELESALGSRTTLLVGGSGAAGLRDFNEWSRATFIGSMSDLIGELGVMASSRS